jgi:CRISPR-associated protein Cas1
VIGRIVEIAEDGRHLSMHRGFMVVSAEKAEVGRVPLDDIGVVIANAHGLTYTNNLLIELAERGVSVVLCGPHHRPVAWLWPMEGHHMQAMRMRAQLAAPAPLGKRLWQILVRAKVQQQAATLAALGRPAGGFQLLARQVRSGDPENIEAQAARRYWPLMFGNGFRRRPDGTVPSPCRWRGRAPRRQGSRGCRPGD